MKPVLPGATVGVLGSGQLGRMFAIAARRMGYRVHTFSPDADTPAGQVADLEVIAPYGDLDAVRRFASGVRVVTFEFENVPAPTAAAAAEHAPVRPKGEVLHTTQHRIREKTFLADGGFPLTPFRTVTTSDELARAVADLGCPSILKTADFGYDGKGQVRVESPEQAAAAWSSIGRVPAVLEAFISFEREVSVVAARGADGAYADWGVIENRHQNHILDISIAPAAVNEAVARQAREIAWAVLEALDVVGVLCVEFFVEPGGRLLINELAPRPHNSGHLTVDASVTSQFEQQLRAVCGLPLGSTELLCPAAMANLLGDVWKNGEPNWLACCAHPNVKLHLYGKLAPPSWTKDGTSHGAGNQRRGRAPTPSCRSKCPDFLTGPPTAALRLSVRPYGPEGPFRLYLPCVFVDYYETLQISPNADQETVHRVYRVQAQRFHPDNQESGNAEAFRLISEAYQTLSDTEKRASYDVQHRNSRHQVKRDQFEQSTSTATLADEHRKRHEILTVLYRKRVAHPDQPAMGLRDLLDLLGMPREQLEFSLWYLKEGGYLQRTDSARHSITLKGVELIETLATHRNQPLKIDDSRVA